MYGGVDANAAQIRRGMAWVFDRYVTGRALYRVAAWPSLMMGRIGVP